MDNGLKQRIIGAVVLVIAAVVFLPMLLTGQDETTRVEVDVPEPPALDDREITLAAPVELPEPEPVAEIPPSLPEPAAPPAEPVAPAPAPAAPPMVTAPSAPPSAPPAAAPPAPAPAAPSTPPAAPASGNWVIQLGSFSSAENAEALRQTLRTQGYNAYTVAARVGGNAITRVFVGPVVERDEANRLRDELARRQGNKGLVVAYDSSNRAQ